MVAARLALALLLAVPATAVAQTPTTSPYVNGVGPCHLAGRALAALASGRSTDLAFADPEPVTVPGEPLAFAGGMLVRRAFLRKEHLEERGERVDLMTRAVTAAPRALGIHVAR